MQKLMLILVAVAGTIASSGYADSSIVPNTTTVAQAPDKLDIVLLANDEYVYGRVRDINARQVVIDKVDSLSRFSYNKYPLGTTGVLKVDKQDVVAVFFDTDYLQVKIDDLRSAMVPYLAATKGQQPANTGNQGPPSKQTGRVTDLYESNDIQIYVKSFTAKSPEEPECSEYTLVVKNKTKNTMYMLGFNANKKLSDMRRNQEGFDSQYGPTFAIDNYGNKFKSSKENWSRMRLTEDRVLRPGESMSTTIVITRPLESTSEITFTIPHQFISDLEGNIVQFEPDATEYRGKWSVPAFMFHKP